MITRLAKKTLAFLSEALRSSVKLMVFEGRVVLTVVVAMGM